MPKKLKFEYVIKESSFVNISGSKERIDFSEGTLQKSREINEDINVIRGIIINNIVAIENLMDFIIASNFSDNLGTLFNIKNLILSKSQITLFLKWQILRDVMEQSELFSIIGNKSEFKRELHEIINIRDDFAHGQLIFDIYSKEPFLEYYRGGKKRKKITQEYLDEISNKIKRVHKVLAELFIKLIKTKYESNEGASK